MTDMTDLSIDAILLAKSRLEEQDARIAELEAALQNTAEWLASACHFVSKNNGLMGMLDQVDAARSVLNKETSRV